MSLETLAVVAEYVTLIEFLLGTVLMYLVVRKLGESTVRSVVAYLLLGTAMLTAVSIFLNIGAEGHGIADESFDVWWHVLFYAAFAFYFRGAQLLVSLGSGAGAGTEQKVGAGKWILAGAIVLFVFLFASAFEPLMVTYTSSALNSIFGLHHFISFALAGTVASYLFSMKSKLGMIGKAIANPFIIAVSALSLQHLWELITESWKLIDISTENIESVEQIFMIIAGTGIIWSAIKLRDFASKM